MENETTGIASYEDKIVQLAVKKILEAIYEPRFLNCMYGFRPHMEWICRYAKSLSAGKTEDLCEVILEVNVTMRSRMRERRTYGSVRGLRRELLVYSTVEEGFLMKKCKITVLKREFYPDLGKEYIHFPDFGPCDTMKEGDEFITSGPFGNECPKGFCAMAWQAVCLQATTLVGGGKVFGHDLVHIACCNDGVRPVIFRLEPYEDEEEPVF